MSDARLRDYCFQSLKHMSERLPIEDWSTFTVESASVRLERLEWTWDKLRALHLEILEKDDAAAADISYALLDDALRIYMNCKTSMQRRINALTPIPPETPSTPSSSEESELNIDVHKTEIYFFTEIGTFCGDFTKWRAFRENFISKVHENAALSNSEKLYALQAAVIDRAAQVLGTWEVTDTNYDLAWNKLCGVYNIQYQIARQHIQSLQTIPHLEQATFDGIFAMIDRVMYAQRQLVTMDVPADKWDLMIIYLIEERLDERSLDAWIGRRQDDITALPKLEEMLTFLANRAVSLPTTKLFSPDLVDKSPSTSKHKKRSAVTGRFAMKNDHKVAPLQKRKLLSPKEHIAAIQSPSVAKKKGESIARHCECSPSPEMW